MYHLYLEQFFLVFIVKSISKEIFYQLFKGIYYKIGNNYSKNIMNHTVFKYSLNLLWFITFPITAVFLSLLYIYKKLINTILYIRHQGNYGGILGTSDTIWTIDGISKCINCLIVINTSMRLEELLTKLREKIAIEINKDHKNLVGNGRLSTTCHEYFGYSYLLKNNVKIEECVRWHQIDCEEYDQELLNETISDVFNKPLPKEDTALWEILICNKPLKWTKTNSYAIIARFHHILGDGPSIINAFVKLFNKGETNTIVKQLLIKKSRKRTGISTNILNVFRRLHVFFVAPVVFYSQTCPDEESFNALHGRKLSGKVIVAWSVEKKEEIVSIVKRIKTERPGKTFTDVILTAVAVSFADFFKRNKLRVPKYVSVGVPVSTKIDGETQLRNNIAAVVYDLPCSNEAVPITRILDRISLETLKINKSMATQVVDLIINKISENVPNPVLRSAIGPERVTFGLTNVPGPSKISLLHSCAVDDIVVLPPCRGYIGIAISILTYDNRLQIGLTVDKALLSSKKEAQRIVEDICSNVRQLHYEIQKEKKLYV